MSKERVLITVKTYPTLSRKYGETVCTAGVRADGSWVRIYPVPFRRLDEAEQYKKYDWIECDLQKARSDPRPESRSPVDVAQLRPVDHMDTADGWRERRKLLLQTVHVHTNLDTVIRGAKAMQMSLAIFKPSRVLDFVWTEEDRDWDHQKLEEIRARYNQMDMFADETWRQTFKLIQKLPYSFSYCFEDDAGRRSELVVLDWEVGALYWRCFRAAGGDEAEALAKVKKKYFDAFLRTDLHFYIGTTQQFHQVAPNPYVIIGVLPIPHEQQLGLI